MSSDMYGRAHLEHHVSPAEGRADDRRPGPGSGAPTPARPPLHSTPLNG
ncbi:hypothetical protein NW249_29785 [Streptomyces sp. OUCMDZ-4982]|nr:hypothetical protein [Streptomyces sp. OUCMDZ-4982]MCR8946297.1 hypothetical protein [Streptomyces sp. OUCMDZ-4982]